MVVYESDKRKLSFKKCLRNYIVFLAILCFIFLIYVMNTLYKYATSFSNNYMNTVVTQISQSAKKGKISKYCNVNNITISNLENKEKSYEDAAKSIFCSSNITYKLQNENKNNVEPVYEIYANDEKIMSVTLCISKQEKRLGLFSYPVWEIKECNLNNERGLYYYDILVPNDYTVKVNNTKLTQDYITKTIEDDNYAKIAKYLRVQDMANYQVNNLLSIPTIEILDNNGNNVDYVMKNNKIEILNGYTSADNYEQAKEKLAKEIDILDIVQKWSLFLTNDLSGDKHGFNELSKYFIKNSSIYNMANAWANSVDITFVSKHTLKNPTFTNTSVKDFTIYNKNAFSCTIYLEKNMTIANGNDKIDKMNERLYFVYYDDTNDNVENPTWKLVDMQSIAEN